MIYLISFICVFFITNLLGHFIHWLLHQEWAGFLNKAHMTHHLILYPSHDYLSEKYREPESKDSTPKFFAIAAIPILITPIILYFVGILPLLCAILCVLETLIIGAIDYYIHDWFHVRNHWINKVPVIKNMFKKWNKLHYLHHIDMTKNFGIYNFFWDKIFKSYWIK